MLSVLILAGLLAVVAIPFVPGVLEILRPRDDRPLALDRSYARDPFVFAHDFRAKFDRRAVLASTVIETGTEAQLGECYARRSMTLGPSSRASAVLSEGTLRLLCGCRIERWTHSVAGTQADAGCDLGRAATSNGRLHMERGVRFQRLYGDPISSYPASVTASPIRDRVVFTGEEGAIQTSGYSEVPFGAIIRGSIRSRSAVRIGSGAHVHGNVIAAAEIIVEPYAVILGHVFSPATIRLGANSRVGSSPSAKTVYGNRVVLAAGVRVFGSIVTDRGGFVE